MRENTKELSHEEKDLSMMQFQFLQICMHRHSKEPEMCSSLSMLCLRTAQALAWLRGSDAQADSTAWVFVVCLREKNPFHMGWLKSILDWIVADMADHKKFSVCCHPTDPEKLPLPKKLYRSFWKRFFFISCLRFSFPVSSLFSFKNARL